MRHMDGRVSETRAYDHESKPIDLSDLMNSQPPISFLDSEHSVGLEVRCILVGLVSAVPALDSSPKEDKKDGTNFTTGSGQACRIDDSPRIDNTLANSAHGGLPYALRHVLGSA